MILDSFLQLANGYAPTATGTDVNGTYVDAGVAQDFGMGNGTDIGWYLRCATTPTSGGSATLQFKLQAATDTAFTSPVDVIVAPAAAVAYTTITAGYELKYKIPRGFSHRYWRVGVVIGTAVLTAGAFDSWLGDAGGMFTDVKSYPGNYTA